MSKRSVFYQYTNGGPSNKSATSLTLPGSTTTDLTGHDDLFILESVPGEEGRGRAGIMNCF